jgi:hypothetical protein
MARLERNAVNRLPATQIAPTTQDPIVLNRSGSCPRFVLIEGQT